MPIDPLHGPQNVYQSDGVTLTYQFSFDDELSDASNINVTVFDDVEADGVDLTEGTDYSVNTEDNTITLVTAVTAGEWIRIYRFTDRDRNIDYQAGSTLRAQEIDEDYNRLTAVTQEIEGNLDDALRKNAAGTAWNARQLEGKNAAPATEGDSWPTYNQMIAAIAQGNTVTIDHSEVIVHRGDGVETDFAITGFRNIDARQIFVFIEGVLQSLEPLAETYRTVDEDDTGYPGVSGGPTYVRFVEAPPDDAIIEIRLIRGTVVGVVLPGSVSSDEIADDAVGLEHINVGEGDAGRILIFDADGDPTAVVPTTEDISDFDEAIAATSLSDLAVPTGNLDINSHKLRNVAAATANDDAVNFAQMLAALDAKIQIQVEEVASNMQTAAGAGYNAWANFDFVPDVIILSVKYKTGVGNGPSGTSFDYDETYIVSFQGSNKRTCPGREFNDAHKAPTLEFERNGDQLRGRIVELGASLQAWTQGRVIALAFQGASDAFE